MNNYGILLFTDDESDKDFQFMTRDTYKDLAEAREVLNSLKDDNQGGMIVELVPREYLHVVPVKDSLKGENK